MPPKKLPSQNDDLNQEAIELDDDNLQTRTGTKHQSRPSSIESQGRHNSTETQQNRNHNVSQIHESQNYHDNLESLPFNANKYQHKISSQMNTRSTILRVQSNEPGVDPEAIELDDDSLQARSGTKYQSRHSSIESHSQNNYIVIQSNQNHKSSQICESQNYHGNFEFSSFIANKYQHKVPSALQLNSRSKVQSIKSPLLECPNIYDNHYSDRSYRPHSAETESSDDEIFSSLGQHYDTNSFKKSSHSALSLNMQNTKHTTPYPTIQSGLAASSTKSETHRDVILQALNSMLSSLSVMSSQLSSSDSPNLAKILSEQSRILFLRTRMPTKRTRTLLIKCIIPNIVNTPDWNGVSSKLRQAFENFHSTYNDDIAKLARFIAGAVWKKPLKRHIDILNYDVFKNQQSGVKALMTFISKCLKIHVEYLVAESRGGNPDYTSMVLNRVKELDYITIDITFPAASHFQHAN
ncbi:16204_t:CDS:2 [Cetraspora pellucida]|uniref:16204_t:CDS:1 n=1 Tax=Cetraspora pellucida TaxID=1433469 RepID=A0A9N9IUE9_9GLOM|nr:16204_t:CDS:2 [Cetraspora pellucida]